MRGSWRVWVAVLVLLGTMAAEMTLSVRRESVSWDEGDHLFAGYMSLLTGDFGINPEHPPMAKMVAALPLLPLQLKVPVLGKRFFKEEAYYGGRELLFRNAPAYSADTLMLRARIAMMVFSLGLGLFVFLAGREMFGAGAGLFALALVVFEPSLLTHGAFVTTDMAITCCYFATMWLLWRYVRAPSIARLLAVGLMAGLALASKHSAIVLLPAVVLVLAGEVAARAWQLRRGPSDRALGPAARYALRLAGAAVLMAVLAVIVLWAFYGFRYAARPTGLRLDPSLAQYVAPLKPIESGTILFLARFHILPESWLFGLADVRRVSDFMPTFFLGKVYAHGIWVYFPTVLLIKLTLGSMGLMLMAAWAAATGRLRRPREAWFLLAPAGVYLLIAMNSQLNIGVRHVLPVLPFLLVFAAGGAWALMQRDRRWVYAAGILFVAHAASTLRASPNYLPYANEAWGGPSQTYKYLSDSNADWGQQLKTVSAYLKANKVHDCWFTYFVSPFILPADYGIPCRMLPTYDTSNQVDLDVPTRISGTVLISAGDQNGFEFGTKVRNPYQAFMGRAPDALLDDGVLVYHGSFDVPLAAAMAPTQRSIRLLAKGDAAGAVREAQSAVALAPASLDAQEQLGKVLARAGQPQAAHSAFLRALALVDGMEPSAQAQWRPILTAEMAASH